MGGCSVREFKARWVRELEAHGVPEPELSVKYIIEHVLQNRKQEDVRFKQQYMPKWSEEDMYKGTHKATFLALRNTTRFKLTCTKEFTFFKFEI